MYYVVLGFYVLCCIILHLYTDNVSLLLYNQLNVYFALMCKLFVNSISKEWERHEFCNKRYL